MKRISMLTLACLLTFCAATDAFAQGRRRNTARKGRPAATTAQSAETNASTARTAATRVAEQIKSLGKFLYLYGPISKELAASETGAVIMPTSEPEGSTRRATPLAHPVRPGTRDHRLRE